MSSPFILKGALRHKEKIKAVISRIPLHGKENCKAVKGTRKMARLKKKKREVMYGNLKSP